MESQTHGQGRGRPSKYKEEYPDKLIAYFSEYLKNPSTQQVIERTKKYFPDGKVKETFEKFKTVSRGVPTLFGFAIKENISYRTLQRWSVERLGTKPEAGEPDRRPYKYPDFWHAYKLASEFQKEFLLSAGMSGSAPAVFAIFSAKNMIGWRDSVDQRFIDKEGNDRKLPGYVLLPTRKTEEEVQEEITSEPGDPTGTPGDEDIK